MPLILLSRSLARAMHTELVVWAQVCSPGRAILHSQRREGADMSGHQQGYIWRKGQSWYGRWWEDVLKNGSVVRTQRAKKLADYGDRYRTARDVRPLLDDILRPLNERKTRPESTLPVAKFVESYYLRFVEENCKPSTIAGYESLWEMYLAGRLEKTILRDFRTVDAARLLAETHRTHKLGRTTLHHIKSFLGGVFTYAKNQGVIDGVNPIHEAMIPKKAAVPEETHASHRARCWQLWML